MSSLFDNDEEEDKSFSFILACFETRESNCVKIDFENIERIEGVLRGDGKRDGVFNSLNTPILRESIRLEEKEKRDNIFREEKNLEILNKQLFSHIFTSIEYCYVLLNI